MAPPPQGGDTRAVALVKAGARQNSGFGRMNGQTPAYGKPGTMTAGSHKPSVSQFASTTEQHVFISNAPRGGRGHQRPVIEDATPAKPQEAQIQPLDEDEQDGGGFTNQPTNTYRAKLPKRGRNVVTAESFPIDKEGGHRGQGVQGGRGARIPKTAAPQYEVRPRGDYNNDVRQDDATDDQMYDAAEDYPEPPAATDDIDPSMPFDNTGPSPAFYQNRQTWENTRRTGSQATEHPHDNQADFSDGSDGGPYRIGGGNPGGQVAMPAARTIARQGRQSRGSPFGGSQVDDFGQHHQQQQPHQLRQVDQFPHKSSNHGHPQHFKTDPNEMLRVGQQPSRQQQQNQRRVNQQHAGQQITERGSQPPHSSRQDGPTGHPHPSRMGGRQPTRGNQSTPGGSRPQAANASIPAPGPQMAFFTGQTFPSFFTPVQGLNMKDLWEQAFTETKAEHKKVVADGLEGLNPNEIFHTLSAYNNETTDAIRDMRGFLRQVQDQQMELKSTVDISVQKLQYKTTLYEKARQKVADSARSAKIWEPKRPRVA